MKMTKCPFMTSGAQEDSGYGQLSDLAAEMAEAVAQGRENEVSARLVDAILARHDLRPDAVLRDLTGYCLRLTALLAVSMPRCPELPVPSLWMVTRREEIHSWVEALIGAIQDAQLPATEKSENILLVRSFIDNNYHQPGFSAKQTATIFDVPLSTLSDRFKVSFGETMGEYIRKKRVKLAKSMLLGSSKSLKDVAYASGFGCYASMHRAFVSIEGKTPGEYRKKV